MRNLSSQFHKKGSTSDERSLFASSWRRTVKEGCAHFGVRPETDCLQLFSIHAFLLAQWNQKVNLTAIRDPFEIAVKHFIDSAALVPYIESGAKILDIGTGAGFPSIVVSILSPGLEVVGVDASRKKISFVKESIRQCRLDGIKAIHARTEELSKNIEYRHSFDVVTSRAFASLDRFVEQAIEFLAPNGTILAMKGKRTDCGNRLCDLDRPYRTEVIDYLLPFIHEERSIIKVRLLDDSS